MSPTLYVATRLTGAVLLLVNAAASFGQAVATRDERRFLSRRPIHGPWRILRSPR